MMFIVLMMMFIVIIRLVSSCMWEECSILLLLWECVFDDGGGLVDCCIIRVNMFSISSSVVSSSFVWGNVIIDSFIDMGGLLMKVILFSMVFSEYVVCRCGCLWNIVV